MVDDIIIFTLVNGDDQFHLFYFVILNKECVATADTIVAKLLVGISCLTK